MKYVIANINAAQKAGINPMGHQYSPQQGLLLNEKEVEAKETLNGSLQERAQQMQGRVISQNEAFTMLSNYVFNTL